MGLCGEYILVQPCGLRYCLGLLTPNFIGGYAG